MSGPGDAYPTSSPAADRVAALDGWRGMAILLVLVGHFSVSAPAGLAPAGVECFFVLSGRLMAEILIVRSMPLPRFLARRASRIVPALAVYVLIMLAALLAAPGYASAGDSLLGAAGALFFFHNYFPHDGVIPFFEHSWSLAIEEHSYLLLAAIVLLTVRNRRGAAAAALVLAVAAMANGLRLNWDAFADTVYPYWRSDVRAASIFLSFALWIVVEPRLRALRRAPLGWLSPLCLAAGLGIAVAAAVPDWVRFTAGTGLLAVAVATIDVADARFRRLFEAPSLVWLGLISYSLYLWQQPLFAASRSGAPLLLCVPIAFACALWSYHAVEKPARARLHRLFSQMRPAGARPAAETGIA